MVDPLTELTNLEKGLYGGKWCVLFWARNPIKCQLNIQAEIGDPSLNIHTDRKTGKEIEVESIDLGVTSLHMAIKKRECRLEREESIRLNPEENQHLKEKEGRRREKY